MVSVGVGRGRHYLRQYLEPHLSQLDWDIDGLFIQAMSNGFFGRR